MEWCGGVLVYLLHWNWSWLYEKCGAWYHIDWGFGIFLHFLYMIPIERT